MGVFQTLSVVALRQLVGGACTAVGASPVGEAVVDFLANRFTDHSSKLTTALQTANERAWKTLELALAGDSFWERCKTALARREDQAFRRQVRSFLDNVPLLEFSGKPDFRKACLQELQAARKANHLTAGVLAPDPWLIRPPPSPGSQTPKPFSTPSGT